MYLSCAQVYSCGVYAGFCRPKGADGTNSYSEGVTLCVTMLLRLLMDTGHTWPRFWRPARAVLP
jgi:hypothetical protein